MRILFNMRARSQNRLIRSMSHDRIKKDLAKTGFALAGLCAAHTGAMMGFEGLSLDDAAWLTLTTATTVGYGDMSAETLMGRASTIGLMYVGGITALAQGASQAIDLWQTKKDLQLNGKWKWNNMKDHIVFMNAPERNPMSYFSRLITEFRKSALPAAQKTAMVISPNLPDRAQKDLGRDDVVHINHEVSSASAREDSNLAQASHIVVLSECETDPKSDSITFDLVSRVREANPNAVIIAEAVDDENKKRLMAVGANHVIRPIRSYPELLVNTILAPGSEHIMADLFDNEGEEMVRYDVPVKGKWGDIQCGLIQNDIGTPLGYIDMSGEVVMAATIRPTETIEAQGLFVVAREGNIKPDLTIAQAVNQKQFVVKMPALNGAN